MENKEIVLAFTVAECGEYHSLGEYHEDIRTLEEAVAIYEKIPQERMNRIPSIGINLHMKGTEKLEDLQADILYGDGINTGIISLIPEFCGNTQVQEAVNELIRRFPDKEVIEY